MTIGLVRLDLSGFVLSVRVESLGEEAPLLHVVDGPEKVRVNGRWKGGEGPGEARRGGLRSREVWGGVVGVV